MTLSSSVDFKVLERGKDRLHGSDLAIRIGLLHPP
jgi:hypothetical protein